MCETVGATKGGGGEVEPSQVPGDMGRGACLGY